MQHAPPLRMPPPPPPAGTRLWEGHDRGVMTERRRCAEAAADCACACTCGSASLVADAASEQRAAALRRLQDVARREVALLEAEHAFVQREAALDAREAQLRAREEALLTAQRLHTQQQKQRASGLGGGDFHAHSATSAPVHSRGDGALGWEERVRFAQQRRGLL